MKKLLISIMALVLLLTSCAAPLPIATEAEPTPTPTPAPKDYVEIERNGTFSLKPFKPDIQSDTAGTGLAPEEPISIDLVFENDELRFTVQTFEANENGVPVIKVKLRNKLKKENIWLNNVQEFKINGYNARGSYTIEDLERDELYHMYMLEPHKSYIATIEILSADVQLDSIRTMSGTIEVMSQETCDVLSTLDYSFVTGSGGAKQEDKYAEKGIEIYNKDGVRVYVLGYDPDGATDSLTVPIYVYAENDSDVDYDLDAVEEEDSEEHEGLMWIDNSNLPKLGPHSKSLGFFSWIKEDPEAADPDFFYLRFELGYEEIDKDSPRQHTVYKTKKTVPAFYRLDTD